LSFSSSFSSSTEPTRLAGAFLQGRVTGQEAGAVAERNALPDEGEHDEVVLARLADDGVNRLEDVLLGGRLAVALLVGRVEQQEGVGRGDAAVVVVGQQVVERLRVGLGVLARLNLRVGELAHADDHGVRLGSGGVGGRRGTHRASESDQGRQHGGPQGPAHR